MKEVSELSCKVEDLIGNDESLLLLGLSKMLQNFRSVYQKVVFVTKALKSTKVKTKQINLSPRAPRDPSKKK